LIDIDTIRSTTTEMLSDCISQALGFYEQTILELTRNRTYSRNVKCFRSIVLVKLSI